MHHVSIWVKIWIDEIQVVLTSNSIDRDSETVYLIFLDPFLLAIIDELLRFGEPVLRIL
jgi:hypothetical protein